MDDVDIIVELIGGFEGIAKKLVFSALKNKKLGKKLWLTLEWLVWIGKNALTGTGCVSIV